MKKKGKGLKFCLVKFISLIVVGGEMECPCGIGYHGGCHPVLGLRRDSDSTVSAIPGSMNFPVILLLVVSKN